MESKWDAERNRQFSCSNLSCFLYCVFIVRTKWFHGMFFIYRPDFSLGTIKFWAKLKLKCQLVSVSLYLCLSRFPGQFIYNERADKRSNLTVKCSWFKIPKCQRDPAAKPPPLSLARVSQTDFWRTKQRFLKREFNKQRWVQLHVSQHRRKDTRL